MKTALITGITGQDGSYLAKYLLEQGYKVYGLVRRGHAPNHHNLAAIREEVTLIEGDLLDPMSLLHVIDQTQPHEIYNLAAQTHVGISFNQPYVTLETNGIAVISLLEAIRVAAPWARFYQASTSELFGNSLEAMQNEQTPFKPVSPYAIAKLTAHHFVQHYREAYGLYACCGILFNHESPRRGLDFVTRKICHGLARIKFGLQEQLELGILEAARDWGYAPDYVRAMHLMLQQDKPKEYVIATGETHTILEFIQAACEVAGLVLMPHMIVSNSDMYRPSDVHHLCGDASLARKELGWRPTTEFYGLVRIMMEAELIQTEQDVMKEEKYSLSS